jgi:YgiT-type zinc finger domain-containing protein
MREWVSHSVLRGGVATWRVAHPQAAFAALEAAVEERVRQVRAAMLGLLLAATPCEPAHAAAPARCPVCGEAMQARGTRTRRLTVEGDHSLPLTRADAVCPVCGTGLFPPR